ncbi:MAG: hypothetical protein K2J95_06645 [Lachnospiraceae bacterium]|nr:hypothetical protein [Lachnospiraceae bacterium]
MIKYILFVIYLLFSVSGLTLFKVGSMQESELTIPVVNVVLSKWTLLGILCYGLSFLIYLYVISKFDLGVIIPIIGGVVNILILLVSYFILKESLSACSIIGAVIISIGIVIMNLGK